MIKDALHVLVRLSQFFIQQCVPKLNCFLNEHVRKGDYGK